VNERQSGVGEAHEFEIRSVEKKAVIRRRFTLLINELFIVINGGLHIVRMLGLRLNGIETAGFQRLPDFFGNIGVDGKREESVSAVVLNPVREIREVGDMFAYRVRSAACLQIGKNNVGYTVLLIRLDHIRAVRSFGGECPLMRRSRKAHTFLEKGFVALKFLKVFGRRGETRMHVMGVGKNGVHKILLEAFYKSLIGARSIRRQLFVHFVTRVHPDGNIQIICHLQKIVMKRSGFRKIFEKIVGNGIVVIPRFRSSS